MKKFSGLGIASAVCFLLSVTTSCSTALADTTIDLGPLFQTAFANGTATDAATGTTVSYFGNNSGGVLDVTSPASTSDFGADATVTGQIGDWAYGCWNVSFGNAFGPNGTSNFISATDFSLSQSSLNGSSNWYEWGMIDLNGGNSITTAQIEAYLGSVSNYDDVNDTHIGTALGADAANDSLNMFGPSVDGGADDDMGGFATSAGTGNGGVDNGNTTWDNTEFGLNANAGISGFTFYYGYSISNIESQRSGPRGSIGTLRDTMTIEGIPEPGSGIAIVALGIAGLIRRRRNG